MCKCKHTRYLQEDEMETQEVCATGVSQPTDEEAEVASRLLDHAGNPRVLGGGPRDLLYLTQSMRRAEE